MARHHSSFSMDHALQLKPASSCSLRAVHDSREVKHTHTPTRTHKHTHTNAPTRTYTHLDGLEEGTNERHDAPEPQPSQKPGAGHVGVGVGVGVCLFKERSWVGGGWWGVRFDGALALLSAQVSLCSA